MRVGPAGIFSDYFFFFFFFADSSAGDIREAVGSEDYDLLVRANDLFFL